MGSIPILATGIQQPSPPSILEAQQRMQAIQAGKQEQQLRSQQVEQQQVQLDDQKAMTSAMQDWDGKDFNELPSLVLKNGGSANAVIGLKQHIVDQQTKLSQLDSDQLKNLAQRHDMQAGALNSLNDVPDEQLGATLLRTVQNPQYGFSPQDAQQAFQIAQMDPKSARSHLGLLTKGLQGEKEQVSNAAAAAEQQKNTALAGEATANTAKTQAETQFYQQQGLAPGVSPEMAGYAAYIKQGGKPEQFKAWQAQQEAKATLPTKVALTYADANARQSAAQGDPSTAGKMLADGSMTLSELKTRGATPQFLIKATQEAQKLKPGYSASDEVVAEQVAKSQGANQFFGSANSLITKGGTLDQLEKLGTQIPQHDFPVLNTIEDWQKLASGKGPLAGYAATALGAADDYGKVMGGGNASDSARNSALSLFSKAASPEQRASAIQATRNAVQSQRDSRIGNNQFLKRQYGSEVSTGAGGGAISVSAPNGKTYSFKDQASADAFKQKAGIK